MSTEILHVWHCDNPACSAVASQRTEGWTDAIYTQGCPAHGEVIAAHKASLDDVTRGRGRSEKTTWYLKCACGWAPSPRWATYTSRGLQEQHLRHVHAQFAAPADTEPEKP